MVGTGTDSGLSALFIPCPVQEGQDYNGAGFGAIIQSIMIDNITPSWLYIPAADRYVPPLTWGVVFQATAQARTAQAQWRTPPGILAAVTLNNGRASVTFTDQFIPPSSGVSLITPSQPIHLGSSATGSNINVTPPPGANTLIIVSTSGIIPATWLVLGTQSGAVYQSAALPATSMVVFVPIDLGTDTSYEIYSNFQPFSVDASYVVQAVTSGSIVIAGVVAENLTEVGGNPISIGQHLMADSLPVVLASDQSQIPVAVVGTVPENLTAIQGDTTFQTPVAGLRFGHTALPISGTQSFVPSAPGIPPYYLPTFQRPIQAVAAGAFTLVAGVGQIMVPAPGVGESIVVNRIKVSLGGGPATAAAVQYGTASGNNKLGQGVFAVGTASAPDFIHDEFVYDGGFLVGDNLPIYITSSFGIVVYYTVMYNYVGTATWPPS